MGGKALCKKILVKAQHVEHAKSLETTSLCATQAEVKLLRSCCENNLVLTLMMLSVYKHQRELKCIIEPARKLDEWMGHAITHLSGGHVTQKWIKEQFSGGFMVRVQECIASLSNEESLTACGFLEYLRATIEERNDVVILDDELAALHGDASLELMCRRMRRCLYFFHGWPCRFNELLLDLPTQAACLREFKTDVDAFKTVVARGRPGTILKRMIGRSVMKLTNTRQWEAACAEFAYAPADDLRALADVRSCGIHQSVPCETLFNAEKNNRQARGKVKVSVPSRCFGIALASNCLGAHHRMNLVKPAVPIERREAALSKSAYGMNMDAPSLSLTGISTTRATPTYYSPGVESQGVATADLPMLRYAAEHENADMNGACMGGIAHVSHRLLVKRESGAGGGAFDWHVLLYHFKESSVLAWPVSLREIPNHDAKYVIFRTDVERIPLLCILSWEDISACTFEWMSVSGQNAMYPGAAEVLPVATRAIVKHAPAALKSVVAQEAFYGIGVGELREMCKVLRAPVASDSSLVDTLVGMICHCLEVSEEEALHIAAKRLAGMKTEVGDIHELMEMDEAVQCLDHNDVKNAQDTQHRHLEKQNEYTEFKEQLRDRKKALQDAAPKKKRRAEVSTRKGRVKKLVNVLEGMSHREAKKWTPPGSYLWKPRSDGAWHSKMPPFKSCSRKWSTYGEAEALKLCLQDAWRNYADLNLMSIDDIPIEGIM